MDEFPPLPDVSSNAANNPLKALEEMFPSVEPIVVEMIFEESHGHLQTAMDILLNMTESDNIRRGTENISPFQKIAAGLISGCDTSRASSNLCDKGKENFPPPTNEDPDARPGLYEDELMEGIKKVSVKNAPTTVADDRGGIQVKDAQCHFTATSLLPAEKEDVAAASAISADLGVLPEVCTEVERGEKVLVILRGAPGSGKSSLAQRYLKYMRDCKVFSTDDFFIRNGKYIFNHDHLPQAHQSTQSNVEKAMASKSRLIIVDNTNTMAWEMRPYVTSAVKHGYKIHIQEPDTPWKFKPRELAKRNTHGVPRAKIEMMIDRYEYNVTPDYIIGKYNIRAPERCSSSTANTNEELQPEQSASPAHDESDDIFISDEEEESSVDLRSQGSLASFPAVNGQLTPELHLPQDLNSAAVDQRQPGLFEAQTAADFSWSGLDDSKQVFSSPKPQRVAGLRTPQPTDLGPNFWDWNSTGDDSSSSRAEQSWNLQRDRESSPGSTISQSSKTGLNQRSRKARNRGQRRQASEESSCRNAQKDPWASESVDTLDTSSSEDTSSSVYDEPHISVIMDPMFAVTLQESFGSPLDSSLLQLLKTDQILQTSVPLSFAFQFFQYWKSSLEDKIVNQPDIDTGTGEVRTEPQDDRPKTVLAPNALQHYQQLQLEKAIKESQDEAARVKKKPLIVVRPVSSSKDAGEGPSSEESSELDQYREQRNAMYKKAMSMRGHKLGGAAAYYSEQAREIDRYLKTQQRQNQYQQFVEANKDGPSTKLDLHYLTVSDAIKELQQFIQERESVLKRSGTNSDQTSIEVVTGKGNRSDNNRSRLRPAVTQWLDQKAYRYSEINSGAVRVYLPAQKGH